MKYVWMTAFKWASWKDFCHAWPNESEEVAKDYVDHFQPGLNWFTRKTTGENTFYAKYKHPRNGRMVTYRIERHEVVTAEETARQASYRAAAKAKATSIREAKASGN